MPDDSSSLVTVARFDRLHEAQLAQTRLADADIPCMLSNPDMTGMTSMFDAEHSGVKVMVPADRAEEAQTILDDEPEAED